MVRTLLAASLVYAYGHPLFDGIRPPKLDRPLQAFHTEVNKAAWTGGHVLVSFDDAWLRKYARAYMNRVDSQIHRTQ